MNEWQASVWEPLSNRLRSPRALHAVSAAARWGRSDGDGRSGQVWLGFRRRQFVRLAVRSSEAARNAGPAVTSEKKVDKIETTAATMQ